MYISVIFCFLVSLFMTFLNGILWVSVLTNTPPFLSDSAVVENCVARVLAQRIGFSCRIGLNLMDTDCSPQYDVFRCHTYSEANRHANGQGTLRAVPARLE